MSKSVLVSAAILTLLATGIATAQSKRPNVVFIYVDDLGYRDAGFNGAPHYQTPHIDRLAGAGMVFTSAYSNGPNCAPSRACLMTGGYTPRHGIYTVSNSDRGPKQMRRLVPIVNQTTLSSDVTTMGELFQAAGYKTGYFGKWHLGKPGLNGPLEQGFDVNIGGNHTGSPSGGYFPPYKNPQLADPGKLTGGRREYLTERLTREAVEFVNENHQQPFFLMLAHYAVHTPIQSRPSVASKYREIAAEHGINANYAAMIESVDESVGELMQTLTEHDLDRNTVVVYYSDNGGHGKITDNAPLRGCKGTMYEGGIRVPLVICWTDTIAAGTRCDVPVSGVDFFETFRVLLDQPVPPDQPLDGADLMPLLTGTAKTLSRPAIFWHFPAYLQGKDYPGTADPHFRTRPCGAIRSGAWKLIEFFENGRFELYNLDNDLGETTNVAEQHPAITRQLAETLHAWQREVNAPIPREPNPDFRSD